MQHERLIQALRFDRPVAPEQWSSLLDVADREHLTLALRLKWREAMPDVVRKRVDANFEANAVRLRRALLLFDEVAAAFGRRSIEYAVLKGFSHWPLLCRDAAHRPQGDLDLLVPVDRIHEAAEALRPLGYQPLGEMPGVPLDHLPPLIRKTGWQWRGDYFDVDMPFSIELHHRLWDPQTERLPAPGIEQFWDRRVHRAIAGVDLTSLDPIDTAGYASLHLLRHLLRGDFRLFHAYEIGCLLDRTADDSEFWTKWRDLHADGLRRLEATGFRFAAEWFGCRIPAQVSEEFRACPEPVKRWFERFARAPLEAKWKPNKNELWLHLGLIGSASDRRAVLARRLLPKSGHKTFYAAHVPDAELNRRLRRLARWRQARHTALRVGYHLRALAPTLIGGLVWWWDGLAIDARFLRFLAAASLYNFGMTVFFLLFNLFLLERGFHEDTLGAVASAMSLGSVAGSLPAAWVLSRWSLGRTLVIAFLGGAVTSAVRIAWPIPSVLLGSAAAGGFCFSLYAISLAPTVAELTSERSRSVAFSIVFALGIGIGAAGGFLGGRLPGLLSHSLRASLYTGCALAALGALAASRLGLPAPVKSERRIYPRSWFIQRFLFVLFFWNIGTGLFNPFFNAYFAKLHMPAESIGAWYSVAQLAQVITVLAAPVVLRRLGPIGGVMSMQLATAAALAALAAGPAGWAVGAVYVGYMAFQYMSEPGFYSLLMGGVEPGERSGASALNFLVIFIAQAIAAALAGAAIPRFGYPMVMLAGALTALLSATALRSLLGARGHTVARIESIS